MEVLKGKGVYRMNQYILFFALSIGSSLHPAWAQLPKRVVSGLVTSKEDGSAIAGVLVYVKGTKNFSGSQQDGMYYIELTDQDTVLVFEMEGFRKQEVRVTESASLNVTLIRGSDSVLRSEQLLRFHNGQGIVLTGFFGYTVGGGNNVREAEAGFEAVSQPVARCGG